jgi:magnesium transporter
VSDGDGAAAPAAQKAGPAAQKAGPILVPCLHNPASHEVEFHLANKQFVWIDLEGPGEDDLAEISKHLHLHPLTVEDAHTFRQRPKIEDYDNYVFLVVFGVDPDTDSGGRILREVHMIISGDVVVTTHRHAHAGLDALRARYDKLPARSEQFLTYEILDTVVSSFIPVLSRIDDDIDEIEEQVLKQPRQQDLQQIFSLKRDLVAMRRVLTPMRDMFLRRADHIAALPGFDTDDKLYFRDLYDELIRTSEMVDAYRDLLSGTTDLYLSTVANRQGEVNRQLTIIATIFLPLSFLTGFFGQNFSLLTNSFINHAWTFWVFGVGLLVASTIGFWIFFRRKGWIGPDATADLASASNASAQSRTQVTKS